MPTSVELSSLFFSDDDDMILITSAELLVGFISRSKATTPVTNGAACEVPVSTEVALLLSEEADSIMTPGAHTETHFP